MTKTKTNALESLRALIAERQQYEQWITTLESKRDGTPAHVFERVQNDYNTRLQRVIGDIKGHAEELQLSISTLSSRLVEVAREEDTKREALQEAELRAVVGEYEPQQWERLKADAEQALERIAADRAALDSQLGELRSIQKLSEVGSTGSVADLDFGTSTTVPEPTEAAPAPAAAPAEPERAQAPAPELSQPASTYAPPALEPVAPSLTPSQYSQPRDQGNFPLEDAAAASAAVLSSPPPVPTPQPVAAQSSSQSSDSSSSSASPTSGSGSSAPSRPRSGKTPPFGGAAAKPKQPESRTDQAKTLKCPECGTPNYPTEWYCERCGGELATM